MDIRSFFTQSNRLVYVLIGVIAIFIFLTIVFILSSFRTDTQERITLQFWGVFDERAAFDRIFREFQKVNRNVTIEYKLFSYADYERAVIDAFASGTGPDLWMVHHTWLPKHKEKMRAMPDKIPGQKRPLKTVQEYQQEFVEVAFNDLVSDGKIYSMPLYIDTLGMYYNRDLFNTAGIVRPPGTWEDFSATVEQLTRLDSNSNIVQSGAAIGSARNINRSSDILMALMIQSGVRMVSDNKLQAQFAKTVENQRVGEIALQYYTDFTNPSKRTFTWNENQHYSIDAFVEGSAAMMFNYSHQIALLRNKTSRLNFAVAPMPQTNPSLIRTYANYWAPAVAASSKYPNEAWQFINFMASGEQVRSYLNETRRPAARRDLIDLQKDDPDLGVFALQALSARSWHQIDNVAIDNIFADMIDDVNLGRASVRDALQNAESKVSILMQRNR